MRWLMIFPRVISIIVAGDGRYFNAEAIQIICRVLAGNGVSNIWIPQGGIMSTPAVSASIRTRDGGKAQGGIVLTASHNPGGPGEDFGIKYNEAFGQPAGDEFTDAVCKMICALFFAFMLSTKRLDLISFAFRPWVTALRANLGDSFVQNH